MPDFVEVVSIEHVVPGTGALVKVSDTLVALFNVDGHVYAIDDVCIRCGSSLAAGELHGTLSRCSGCDWQYDVATGAVDGVPALCLEVFEVKVADGAILVSTTAKQSY